MSEHNAPRTCSLRESFADKFGTTHDEMIDAYHRHSIRLESELADALATLRRVVDAVKYQSGIGSTVDEAEKLLNTANTAVRGGAPPRSDVTSRAGSATNGGDS